MILIIGRFRIEAEHRTAFLSYIDQLVEHERHVTGCERFEMYEDATQPNHYLMLEQWIDRDALDRHTDTPEFDANEERLAAFFSGEPNWEEYEF